MKHINRLLQAARKAAKGQGMQIIAFVEYSPIIEAYTAAGSIWNGAKGAGVERFYSEHSTIEEAESACNAMKDKYPEAEIIVFVDDMPLEDEP